MKNAVVNELISTMREVTPKEGNLANVLMDILCMSKEAIYRRLRGEVAYVQRSCDHRQSAGHIVG